MSTSFTNLAVPVISFSASDHDDSAIAGIGQAVTFDDNVTLQVPNAFRDHPALGGLGADGTIPWTVQGPTTLQGIGKTHNGGKAIALVEDPTTEALVPAIFVIEEGAPLLGAFSPDLEGDHYIVGSALNKNPVPLLIPCHRVVRSDGQIAWRFVSRRVNSRATPDEVLRAVEALGR